MAPPEDLRRSQRAPLKLRIGYEQMNTFFADYTKNISKGGTFIRTDKPLDVGTEFIFALAIPHLSEPLRLRGRVVWTTTPDRANDESPSGMGIRFQYAQDKERADTEGIVEKLMRDQLGDHLSNKLLGRKG